jgi:hypothetical protein
MGPASRVAHALAAAAVANVADLLAGSDCVFHDDGEHVLKGVPGAWRLFLVEAHSR